MCVDPCVHRATEGTGPGGKGGQTGREDDGGRRSGLC